MSALALLLHLLLGFTHPLPTHDVLQPNGIVAQCNVEDTCLIPPLVVTRTLPGGEVP